MRLCSSSSWLQLAGTEISPADSFILKPRVHRVQAVYMYSKLLTVLVQRVRILFLLLECIHFNPLFTLTVYLHSLSCYFLLSWAVGKVWLGGGGKAVKRLMGLKVGDSSG